MNKKILLTLVSLSITSSLIAPLYAEEPNPNEVSIKEATYSGKGCNSQNAASLLSPDGQVLTILFDDYSVDLEDTSKSKISSDCEVSLNINTPANWSYTLFSMQFREEFPYHSGHCSSVSWSRKPASMSSETKATGPRSIAIHPIYNIYINYIY